MWKAGGGPDDASWLILILLLPGSSAFEAAIPKLRQAFIKKWWKIKLNLLKAVPSAIRQFYATSFAPYHISQILPII